MRRSEGGRRLRLLFLVFLSLFAPPFPPAPADETTRNLTLENLEGVEVKLSLLLQERIFARRRGRASVQPLTPNEFRLAQFLIRNHRELLALLTEAFAGGFRQAAEAFGDQSGFVRLERLFADTYDLTEALEQVSSLPELAGLFETRRERLRLLRDAVKLSFYAGSYGIEPEEALRLLVQAPFDTAALESRLARRLQQSCEEEEAPAAPYPFTHTIEFDDQVLVVHGTQRIIQRLQAMLADVSPPYVSANHILERLSRWEETRVERFFRPRSEPLPLEQKTIRAAVFAGDLPPLASLAEPEAERLMQCLGFTAEKAEEPPAGATLPFCFARWSGFSAADSVWLTPCPRRGRRLAD